MHHPSYSFIDSVPHEGDAPPCPVAATLSVIGDKWKFLFVSDLLGGTMRFNELNRFTGPSQKVLAENLRAMEADGLLTRTVYAEVPPRVEYALTELGMTLAPVLDAMARWGQMYKEKVAEEE